METDRLGGQVGSEADGGGRRCCHPLTPQPEDKKSGAMVQLLPNPEGMLVTPSSDEKSLYRVISSHRYSHGSWGDGTRKGHDLKPEWAQPP